MSGNSDSFGHQIRETNHLYDSSVVWPLFCLSKFDLKRKFLKLIIIILQRLFYFLVAFWLKKIGTRCVWDYGYFVDRKKKTEKQNKTKTKQNNLLLRLRPRTCQSFTTFVQCLIARPSKKFTLLVTRDNWNFFGRIF